MCTIWHLSHRMTLSCCYPVICPYLQMVFRQKNNRHHLETSKERTPSLWVIICTSLSEALWSLVVVHQWSRIQWCPGLTPSRQLKPRTAAHSLPSQRGWGGIGRVKVRKLAGGDKDSLIGTTKATSISRAKQGIHSAHPTGRCSGIPRKAELPHM